MLLRNLMRKSGMILVFVVVVAALMSMSIFSYHTLIVQQTRQTHHEQTSEVVSRLAFTGANMLAEHANSGNGAIINLLAAQLLVQTDIPSNKKFAGMSSGGDNPGILDAVQSDFNLYLAQLDDVRDSSGNFAVCTKMEIFFDNCERLGGTNRSTAAFFAQDPVEKRGEITLSCNVSFNGLERRAEIRKQFKVVTLVPGIYARFSLFVPYTPDSNSYNTLGVNYSGTIDSTYFHPFPSSRHFSAPLKIFNGTDTFDPLTAPDARQDLKNRGWIFLGPAINSSNEETPVVLKIPSGYENQAGGMFHFSRPLSIDNSSPPPARYLIVPPGEVDESLDFHLTPTGCQLSIGSVLQGFYTNDPSMGANARLGAGSAGMWPNLTTDFSAGTGNDRHKCASTWLFPYGDLATPSRTLMVGNVIAGFLKFHYMKDVLNTSPLYKFRLKSRPLTSTNSAITIYNPDDRIDDNSNAPKYSDVFLLPATGTDKGYESFRKVFPRNFLPADTGSYFTQGIAFNSFFDCLNYPGTRTTSWYYPAFGDSAYVPIKTNDANTADPFYLPGYTEIASTTGINGLQGRSLAIRFSPTDGEDPTKNKFFEGDLSSFRIDPANPLGDRVTHYIDVSLCEETTAELSQFTNLVFSKLESYTPPGHPASVQGTWYIPKFPGILLVRRNPQLAGTPLALPGKIYLTKSLVLCVNEGDFQINDRILSPLVDGVPSSLFSLISAKGNIRLGTSDEVDAYLVALKPGTGANSQGGRLLSAGGNTTMNIFGGLAIWEMGLYPANDVPTTMRDFPGGGTIRYNPRFNPSFGELYSFSRQFVVQDVGENIAIAGANRE